MQKEFVKIIKDKNEEIFRLKDHSQKLLTQIKKSKDRKQCFQKLEQENEDIEKKLLEKDEESSHLKNPNQILFEQIKMLKEEKSKKEDKNKVEKSDKEEKMGPPELCSSQSGSRYSMSRTCGPRDIFSLVIPKLGDNRGNTDHYDLGLG